jgi:hypothetical protein
MRPPLPWFWKPKTSQEKYSPGKDEDKLLNGENVLLRSGIEEVATQNCEHTKYHINHFKMINLKL